MRLLLCDERYEICRLDPTAEQTVPLSGGAFFSWTRTRNELSLICREGAAPRDAPRVEGYRRLEVAGPLDLETVGVLASLAVPLGEAGVSIFVLSTFDTDHLLVRDADLERAVEALEEAGHEVVSAARPGRPET